MIRDYVWIAETWAGNRADRNEKILTILWKQVLKQAFGWGEDLQEEVVPLSNVFSNRLNDLVNTSDEEDVISRRQTGNATSPRLPGRGKNKVAGNSQMQKGASRRNRVAGHSEREEKATGRNGVAGRSDREEGMEGANGDMSEVSFLDRKIIKYNWKRKKRTRL